MAKITIQDLMEAGVHFGHQTKRWNPKMKAFVYGAKDGISIIDLTKTIRQIGDACNFLQRVVMNGGMALFVGTKRQAQQLVRETAEKTGMYFVTERWLGGTLTNNITIRKSISRMNEIDKIAAAPETAAMKKKELISLTRKATKLHRDLDGIATMKRLPDVLIIVDVCHDNIAVREAVKLGIPIIGIVDTNADPESINYPIAANDDAVRSIKIIVDLFSDAIGVASEIYQKRVIEERAKAEAEKAVRDAEARERAEKARERAKTEKKDKPRELRDKKDNRPFEKKKAPLKKKEGGEAEVSAPAAPEVKEKAPVKNEAPVVEKAPEVKAPAKKEAPVAEKAAEVKAPAKKEAPVVENAADAPKKAKTTKKTSSAKDTKDTKEKKEKKEVKKDKDAKSE
ncbi:MAG: 30S ribosomal protein S2 [Lentisphaerae bacterium GWF2_44_16]|nr:MAG: 30S ribosomal protein S2 [Lentisphaerae bacterium GWF2_44_16]